MRFKDFIDNLNFLLLMDLYYYKLKQQHQTAKQLAITQQQQNTILQSELNAVMSNKINNNQKYKHQKQQSYTQICSHSQDNKIILQKSVKIQTKSQYLQQYADFLQLPQNIQHLKSLHQAENTQVLYQKLKLANIQICSESVNNFTVIGMLWSNNFEVVQLTVQMSNLKMNITLLNTDQQQIIENQITIHKHGAFGQVYLCQFCGLSYAIKKINRKPLFCCSQSNISQKIIKDLLDSVKQYFFAKLFSALQIGPKIKQIFGFDLIVTSSATYFSMEVCQKLVLTYKQDLTRLIKTMHSLKIVHRDIKTSNLMYSKEYNSCVFIDFGGCMFVQEQIGYKSFTQFYGTLRYCSQQMKQLEQNFYMVDLYFNDLFALKIVFKEIFVKQNIKKSQNQKRNSHFNQTDDFNFPDEDEIQQLFEYQCFTVLCKSYIWNKKIDKLVIFIQQQKQNLPNKIQESILNFLMQITPYQESIQFYQNQISFQQKQKQRFRNLLAIYTMQYSFTYEHLAQCPQTQIQKVFSSIYLEISSRYESLHQHCLKILSCQRYKYGFSQKTYSQTLLKLQNVKKMSKEDYFMLILDYITFTQNYFEASLQRKQKVCKIFLQYVEQESKSIHTLQDSFQQPLINTFLYLLEKGIKSIKNEDQIQFCLKVFQNLFLLGVRVSDLKSLIFIEQWRLTMSMKDKLRYFWGVLTLSECYHQKVLHYDFHIQSSENKNAELNKSQSQDKNIQSQQKRMLYNKQEKVELSMQQNYQIIEDLMRVIITMFTVQIQNSPKYNQLKLLMNKIFEILSFQKYRKSYKNIIWIIHYLKNRNQLFQFSQKQYTKFSLSLISYLKSQLHQPYYRIVFQINVFIQFTCYVSLSFFFCCCCPSSYHHRIVNQFHIGC